MMSARTAAVTKGRTVSQSASESVGGDGQKATPTSGNGGAQRRPMRCVVFGHDYTFSADGPMMMWQCSRDCGSGGSKAYLSATDASRYARAFDRRDTDDLGRRAPLIGLLPLRILRWIRRPGGSRRAGTERTGNARQ